MSRASLICLSKDIIKEINSTIYSFIWRGNDKIRRHAIISDYKYGGLRMSDLQTLVDTQRIMCLKKYCEDYYRRIQRLARKKHCLLFILSVRTKS